MNRSEFDTTAQYLDEIAPLLGASHSEVIDYTVTVPYFYAELQACLASGETTRLMDPRQFLGWLGYGPNPTLLFDCGGERVVVNTGKDLETNPDIFIARNGGQIPLHA